MSIIDAIINAFVALALGIGGKLWSIIRTQQHIQRTEKEYMKALQSWAKAGTDWIGEFKAKGVSVNDVFVPPDLVREMEREPLKMALQKNPLLVVVGKAGAGKSTLVRYVTWTLAQQGLLGQNQADEMALSTLGIPAIFPVRVELKHWDGTTPLVEYLLKEAPSLIDQTWLQKRLDQGVFIFLDGLDEVRQHQDRLIHEIGALTDRLVRQHASRRSAGLDLLRENRILVTTRFSSFSRLKLSGFGYEFYTLQDLSKEQQCQLIQKYFSLWYKDKDRAHQEARNLFDCLHGHLGLRRLAGNPLLLSQIARLHYGGESFAGTSHTFKEHELYERILTHLICRRQEEEIEKDPEFPQKQLSMFGELAIQMHMAGRYDIPAEKAEQALQALGLDTATARQCLQQARDRYLLRQEETPPGRYYFVHQSFQEYLAAYAICKHEEKYRSVLQSHLLEEFWNEVLVLYASMSAAAGSILATLVGMASDEAMILASRCLRVDSPHRKQVLKYLQDTTYSQSAQGVHALEALCWIQPEGLQFVMDRIEKPYSWTPILERLRDITNPIALYELREALLARLSDQETAHEPRIRLAEALGVIRDPRLGQMIEVELAGHRIKVGKFPVTEQEYASFVQNTDRSSFPEHWVARSYPSGRANHPVTNVFWKDAQDYCGWLAKRQKREGQIRLPTAGEWLEIAQSGDADRPFPWGNERDEQLCNCRHQVKRTTPVGIYPEGETPTGVADLLGNVWEWTSTPAKEGYVLKGGAYDTLDILEPGKGVYLQRVEKPGMRHPSIGFRIVEDL